MYINLHAVDPHAVCLGELDYFIGDPHDNKLEEVVQFPRLLRNCMKDTEGFLQRFIKTFRKPKKTSQNPTKRNRKAMNRN